MLKPEAGLVYIPKPLKFISPLKPASIMRTHSLGNLCLGLLLTSGLFQPVSLWLVLTWWRFVLPLCARIDITDGLRDFAIITTIVALIILR